jgi:hypothetical protein
LYFKALLFGVTTLGTKSNEFRVHNIHTHIYIGIQMMRVASESDGRKVHSTALPCWPTRDESSAHQDGNRKQAAGFPQVTDNARQVADTSVTEN